MATAGPLPGRCSFFVVKKKRFCKMTVGKGKTYCGEHGHMEEGEGGGGGKGDSRRIPCPLDPKHTVYEDKLQKHLKRCNSREKPKPVYYVENRNSGSADGDETLQQVSLCERSRAYLESLINKLKAAAKGLQCEVEDSILSHQVLDDELNNPKNGDSAHKHLRQQSSILGHLEEQGLMGGGRCFVEFGAGRGKLSHWIHEALKTCQDLQLLLVERATTRFKVDGKHQDSGAQFERVQVDIQHLDLSKVPLLQNKSLPIVAVGKHLCGAATDLALRCLLETPDVLEETERPQKRLKTSELSESQTHPGPGSGPVPVPILGLVVALCCHHRCEWRHFVGRQFFEQKGLGAEEFDAVCRMSSWATCGLRPTSQQLPAKDQDQDQDPGTSLSGEDETHEPVEEVEPAGGFLSASERMNIGKLCKLLIDAGRRFYLQSKGFDSKLKRYVDSEVTLENVLLTARPLTSSHNTS